jgi:hypothetical protein
MSSQVRRFRGIPCRFTAGLVIALGLIIWHRPAFAYRPFDGTDAAVAKKGEMEIEFQPAGRLRDESGTTLIAPATVINYGLSERWEAVFEGQGQTPLSPIGPTNLTAAGAFLKGVLVPGSLQDKSGPSVATEFGVYFRTAPAIQVSAPVWPALSRSAGIGEQFILTRRRLSRATIMATSSSVPSSKGRRHGRFARSPKFSTKTSSESSGRFPA